jgi:glycosyltransferase involved in cell wall biosynthesis
MIARVALDGLPLQVRSAGIAVYTDGLVRALARQHPETEFVLFGMAAAALGVLQRRSEGPDGAPWPSNVRWHRALSYPLRMGYPLAGMPRVLPLPSRLRACDLFHATNFAAPRTGATPLVVTVHDLALLRFPELGTAALRRIVEGVRDSVATARRIIAVSQATRRDLIELLQVPEDKIRVVYSGCDERFRPMAPEVARTRVRERYGLAEPYILHVGTLEPRKNLERLVRAYTAVRQQQSIPQLLVLAGPRGWLFEGLLRVIRAAGLGPAVRLLGAVPADDLPALYAAAEVFTFPSLYEGFGLPVVEAMACGVPVIASTGSSLPEIAGDAALYVDPHDESALAAALYRVLTDAPLRLELRDKGLERARAYSWERCARATFAIYAEAVASP